MKIKQNRTIKDKLTPFGKCLRTTGACRFYHNGDGAGFVWKWWHPVAWVLAPILFVILCILEGVPEAIKSRRDIGFKMDPYFIKNPDRLIWEEDERNYLTD